MKKILFSLFLLLATMMQAQNDSEVLMTINGKPVYTTEFERMYTKNLDLVKDAEQKDIDNYKNLFTHYKLELEDAYVKHYDTLPKLQRELKTYRRDLAKKYLSDNEIIDQLVKEAYDRMQQDIHVAHILIQVAPEASPKDTLAAYKKIMDIYHKAQNGADFGQLAKQYSQDPSAQTNQGDLDYINVFHTVYPFETAAYTTPVGKISKPFRTRFGYHIVKVLDKRPAKGEIQVAHIMTIDKRLKKENQADAKTRIFEIYEKLKNNQDSFENLAKKYSDDKRSGKSGGRLGKFGIRAMLPEFEKEGFALKNVGDYSKPFQTKYGWHIIKLLKKYPVPAYNEIQEKLRQKVMRDERSKMGKEKLMKKIEKEFPIEITGSLDKVYKVVGKDFFENKWKIPQTKYNQQPLFVIDGKEPVSYQEFFEYLYKRQYQDAKKYAQKKKLIQQYFDRFKKDKLFAYYNKNLERIYPEFADIMNEYKNGLMLFYIKSDQVWDKSIKDTIGIQKFYETHRQNYKEPKKYVVVLIQANDKKTAKKIKKDLSKGKDIKYIKEKYKDKHLIVKEKEYNTEDTFIKKHDLANHKQVMYKDGKQYMVLYLKTIKPERIPELEEIKGKVTNDYQAYLEQQWLQDLQKKYPVQINEQNWQKIRAKYKK